jgi:hypothetical protein
MPDAPDVPQQSCPACGTVVDVTDLEPLVNVACPSCGAKFRVERAFDNFVVVETLGVGGMGSVYKARDTRLDRFVALKLLRKELSADPTEAARLEQEARVTAAVNHPNVVQVYSTGTDHGQIYLVMELVEHGSLDDLMAQTPRVPEAQVLETGIQVAKGLQAAHSKGLIHRDVKPANILFADAQTAKIGDFGLAVAAEQKAEAQQEIWGTPYYVAPERLNNEPEDVRSDIYSLGATLFHAIAGRPPIDGESTSATELRRLKDNPPDLRTIAPDVSRETSRVINKMLAPAPADRYPTYAALITDLQAAAGAMSGTKIKRKSRAPWIAAVVILLLALIALGVYMLRTPTATIAPAAPAASATPDNTAALETRYQQARRQFIEGKYDAAETSFKRLAIDAQDRQPLLNWSRFHAGVAALLQAKTAPAREAFQQVATTPSNSELANFFVESARKLGAAEPIAADSLGALDLSGPGAFLAFAGGLKNWQLGKFAEAASLFEAFSSSAPAGEFAWINDYKPIAAKHLADHRAYVQWSASAQQFATAAEVRGAIEKVRAVEKKLQTKGPLVEAVKADLKRLTAEATKRDKAEKTAREEEQQRMLAEQTPLWETALAETRRHLVTFDYAAALARIDRVAITETSLKQAQAEERKKIGWLHKWKATLIDDINRGRFNASIEVGGVSYTGASKADETRITFLVPPYGSVPTEWVKIPAEVLLRMSNTLIDLKAEDSAERQWLSAVFAAATDQAAAARELSDAAIKAKPEYAKERGSLALPKP